MCGLKGETTTFTSSTFSPWLPQFFSQNGSRVGTATAVHAPTSRSACGNRKTLRQAPAPQRTVVAHSVHNSANYTFRVSHLGSPQLRACSSHTSSPDRDLRTAPFSLKDNSPTAGTFRLRHQSCLLTVRCRRPRRLEVNNRRNSVHLQKPNICANKLDVQETDTVLRKLK